MRDRRSYWKEQNKHEQYSFQQGVIEWHLWASKDFFLQKAKIPLMARHGTCHILSMMSQKTEQIWKWYKCLEKMKVSLLMQSYQTKSKILWQLIAHFIQSIAKLHPYFFKKLTQVDAYWDQTAFWKWYEFKYICPKIWCPWKAKYFWLLHQRPLYTEHEWAVVLRVLSQSVKWVFGAGDKNSNCLPCHFTFYFNDLTWQGRSLEYEIYWRVISSDRQKNFAIRRPIFKLEYINNI